jgi:hypothetical protein
MICCLAFLILYSGPQEPLLDFVTARILAVLECKFPNVFFELFFFLLLLRFSLRHLLFSGYLCFRAAEDPSTTYVPMDCIDCQDGHCGAFLQQVKEDGYSQTKWAVRVRVIGRIDHAARLIAALADRMQRTNCRERVGSNRERAVTSKL